MIDIPDELHQQLQEEADGRGITIKELLVERFTQVIPAITSSEVINVDQLGLHECAERLLEELDMDHARIIRDVCAESGQSPAAYVISIMRLSRERGEMVPPLQEIDIPLPAYGFTGQSGQPIEVECHWCRKVFIPTRKGQIYCPQPEVEGAESCARQAALEPRRQKKKDNSQFAPRKQLVG